MSTFTIMYAFYDPRSPKCRACAHYGENPQELDFEHVAKCQCKENKINHRNRWRNHNSKACSSFRLGNRPSGMHEKKDGQ